MDRVKMLSNAFVLLSEVDGDFFDASRFLTVSIYIKKLFVLAGKFYPEYIRRYESYAYRLGENGEIFSGTMELDIEEDILPQFTAGWTICWSIIGRALIGVFGLMNLLLMK